MATLFRAAESSSIFPYDRWRADAARQARRYAAAPPFPHIHIPEFLYPEVASALAAEFPEAGSSSWTQYKHYNENKAGLTKRALFPPLLGQLVDDLNSPEFLAGLSKLTGIPHLLADPTLEGGGLHQSARGGFLNVHADFTMHHHHDNWRRRINLILYLNPGWLPEWGGAIELWDESVQRCVASVPPLLNHALIFSTTETSFHGFPEKLTCPAGVSRKSLALYYYTLEEQPGTGRSTNYRARPADGKGRSAMIWLDKKAVHAYSRVKKRLGIGDGFASKILGFFSRGE